MTHHGLELMTHHGLELMTHHGLELMTHHGLELTQQHFSVLFNFWGAGMPPPVALPPTVFLLPKTWTKSNTLDRWCVKHCIKKKTWKLC